MFWNALYIYRLTLMSFLHMISSIPYKWLFPRCAAAIHHGGRWELVFYKYSINRDSIHPSILLTRFSSLWLIAIQWIHCCGPSCRNSTGWFYTLKSNFSLCSLPSFSFKDYFYIPWIHEVVLLKGQPHIKLRTLKVRWLKETWDTERGYNRGEGNPFLLPWSALTHIR